MTADVRDWIETFTGARFSPLRPDPALVRVADIAHSLAYTCRYRGHCSRYYSVAEHSVLVSRYVPSHLALEGLLHDAAEAYLGDVPRPLKRQPEMLAYGIAEARVEACVAARYGLRTDPEALAAVKEIDSRVLWDEILALMRPEHHEDTRDIVESLGGPLGCTVEGLLPERAEFEFLRRFNEIGRRA